MIRLVGDRQAYGHLEPETLLQMLQACEMAVRSSIAVEAPKKAMGELRIGVTAAVTRLLPSGAYEPA